MVLSGEGRLHARRRLIERGKETKHQKLLVRQGNSQARFPNRDDLCDEGLP